MENVPAELIAMVLGFLPVKELCTSASLVNKQWWKLSRSEWIWRDYSIIHFEFPSDINSPPWSDEVKTG